MRSASRLTLLIVGMMVSLLLASGMALAITRIGGDADNNFLGTAQDDFLDGQGGNDKIQGLAGNDRIEGGDGADRLFGGDEPQNFLSGNDAIYGQRGSDEVIGGYGADVLNGGTGNDIIFDGPGDDSAVDTIVGGDGDDRIQATTVPAARDSLSCGSGMDDVQVDPLDEVASDCEKVDVFEAATSGATPQEDTGGDPLYISPTLETDEGDVDEEVESPPGATTQDGYVYVPFTCHAPPAKYKKLRQCTRIDPGAGREVGVGLFAPSEARWVYVEARADGEKKGSGRIHKDHDAHDWLYTSSLGYPGAIYVKTSKWNVRWDRWTYMDGYKDFRN